MKRFGNWEHCCLPSPARRTDGRAFHKLYIFLIGESYGDASSSDFKLTRCLAAFLCPVKIAIEADNLKAVFVSNNILIGIVKVEIIVLRTISYRILLPQLLMSLRGVAEAISSSLKGEDCSCLIHQA